MPLFESLADNREAFIVEEMAEEYLLFPSDLHRSSEQDEDLLAQDGPHQTLQWRKKVRQ